MTGQPFLASFCNGFTHHFSMEKSGDGWRGRRGCPGREWLFFFLAMLGSVGGRIWAGHALKRCRFGASSFLKQRHFSYRRKFLLKKVVPPSLLVFQFKTVLFWCFFFFRFFFLVIGFF
jgi:hypothetical protein